MGVCAIPTHPWRNAFGAWARCSRAMRTFEAMRVGILDLKTHRSLEACFAVPTIGTTLVTIDPRVTADQLRKIERHSRLHLLLASSEFVPMVCESLARAPVVPRLVTMGKAGNYETLISISDAFFEFLQLRRTLKPCTSFAPQIPNAQSIKPSRIANWSRKLNRWVHC
jgi:acyl-CoA synthetase (AMP-forming)/AMP-acid ligase II